ncbi:MAG TPA: molybdate ABC transporter substrate-binding protein [Dokdonella sp.]|uniref:molybdate ABC transporter substrate-binding protein n=1 Tax=Dokdonella sp. TaxID=2291710 RepID=UPI002C284F93|nr:molybdate ABC transporter substrate-binding protein [Dokdonella sp.]HUD43487.1 molybdate ABC transporter substrate-binding protein [Dokdonella sp.]
MMLRPHASTWLRASLLALILLLPATPLCAAEVLVFAAASLKPALDAIIAGPEAQAIGTIRASYAASSQLARQIEHGAPAAIFISADQDWMDHVEARGAVAAGTRVNLIRNALVLVAPAASEARIALVPGVDLAAALGADGRLAIGEPNSVPAGKYAKAALTSLGAWDAVSRRIVAADSVRAALAFVVRGEAPLGIVYRSDAVSEPAVRILDTFPAATHAPIVYPLAVLAAEDGAPARAFAALLRGPAAQAVFERYGFGSAPVRSATPLPTQTPR